MNRKRGLAGLAVSAVVVLAVGWSVRGAKAQSGAPATAKTAEQQFKNIQVLKSVPADQIFPTMQFISISLGVECEFCHVEGAFDKDDKDKKKKARDMMRMMITINQENFDGHRVVTCYSCHRGSNAPVGTPIISDLVPKETPGEIRKGGVVEAKLPPADQIVETYVKALGGAAAIDKIFSRTQKGKIQFAGGEFPIDVSTKDGDKRISFTHMPEGDNITAFDGSEGWLIAPGRPGLREMHGSDLDAAGMDADLHFATHLKQMFSETHVEQGEKIGDHETYLVIGKREHNTPVKLYFDQQSGLLVRLVRFGETALGLLPTQIDYSDYRQAEGVQVPFHWMLARANGRFTIQVSEMQQNVPVDDAKFVKPPQPPDSGKGRGH
jgi:photosynthetic reaction center cytochrome c subunit